MQQKTGEKHHFSEISITPYGIGNDYECGCLEGTIFYETLHQMGFDHGNDLKNNAEAVMRKCVPCGIPGKDRPKKK